MIAAEKVLVAFMGITLSDKPTLLLTGQLFFLLNSIIKIIREPDARWITRRAESCKAGQFAVVIPQGADLYPD